MADDALPLLVYDGDCAFCTSCARWLAASWQRPAHVVAWQRLDADELAGLGLSAADVRGAAWWLDAAGRRFRGHLAIGHALAAGRGWWTVCGRLLLVPPVRWIGAGLYPLVARSRHRLPGGTPDCRIGPPDRV